MPDKSQAPKVSYPTDVTDAEWEFCAPYLTLMNEEAPQREHRLREVFNAVRYVVRAGCPWRLLPNDLPPWWTVHQQTQRWIKAGCFEVMADDLRALLRELAERSPQPSAVILDGRTMQSTPESGARAGYDGDKRKKGSKVHVAVDTLGHLLALKVTPANEQELCSKWPNSLPKCRQPPGRTWRRPLSIKVIPAKNPAAAEPRAKECV